MIVEKNILVGHKILIKGVWHTVKEVLGDGIKTNKKLFVEFGSRVSGWKSK